MRPATSEDIPDILAALKKDLENCLYIYIDIKHYGINDTLRVWRNAYGEVRTIIMHYHDSLQLYSTGLQEERQSFIHIIEEQNVRMISGQKELIESILPDLCQAYCKTVGLVHEVRQFMKFERPEGFGVAEERDMYEMASLVCSDRGIGGYYTVEDLTKQYIERLKMKMGRNYYVKKDGVLQAHIATYAEDEIMAITSGMIARPDAVPFGCGTILEGCLFNDLLQEGKRVFTFTTDSKRSKYLKIMGVQSCGAYVKLVRR